MRSNGWGGEGCGDGVYCRLTDLLVGDALVMVPHELAAKVCSWLQLQLIVGICSCINFEK